ncbi:MAG: AAA family ATPase [Gemmatimonadales bacterium]
MRDQAAVLRAMMSERRPDRAEASGPPTLVVGSGKGGVGKSVVSVLLAQRLAAEGRRVLLVDGTQNMGNLHVLLGVQRPSRLEHLLSETIQPKDLLIPVSEQLMLLPADSGDEGLYALPSVDRARLHHRLSTMYDDFDAVIIDAGPGLESVVRVATMRATRLVIVTVPEPAALTDAYATIKIVHMQVSDLPIDVIVNRVIEANDGPATFERLATASQRFLHRELRYLGALEEDDAIRHAVRHPGRLVSGLGSGPNSDTLTQVLELLDLPLAAGAVR